MTGALQRRRLLQDSGNKRQWTLLTSTTQQCWTRTKWLVCARLHFSLVSHSSIFPPRFSLSLSDCVCVCVCFYPCLSLFYFASCVCVCVSSLSLSLSPLLSLSSPFFSSLSYPLASSPLLPRVLFSLQVPCTRNLTPESRRSLLR